MTGKVRKVKLADVLWRAANEHLRDGLYSDCASSGYTCDAVAAALRGVGLYERYSNPCVDFLRQLGLPREAEELYNLFDAFKPGPIRQGVRYMWLLLAMHVAEDEGIEIEVQA